MAKIVNRLLIIDGHKNNGDAIWKKIGVIMENKGKQFMLLDRTFNPAGVAQNDLNSSAVMVTIASAEYSGPDLFNGTTAKKYEQLDDIPF